MSETTFSTTPAVTALLSIHNGVKTLDRCLESIITQTLPNLEILCIDDASTDGTPQLLASWKEKYPNRITVIRNEENLGLTLSLNKGIDRITTPLIARIDADDWWEPTKIEKQVAFLMAHPDHGVIGTNYINHAPQEDKPVRLPETDALIKKTLFWRNPFAHSSVMYRTELIKQAGKYNPEVRYAQDYELWVRIHTKTKFANLPEFLCHRTLGVGISVDRQNDQMRQYLKVLITCLPKYHRPLRDYGAMIEPLIVLALPNWVKKLKRKYFP